jgi:iron complex outermembrane recepter protein
LESSENMKIISPVHYRTTFLFILFSTVSLIAQQTEKIQLLDKTSRTPIIGATWQYAAQTGLSNKDGFIEFQYFEGESMNISHISYGKWILKGKEVKYAISDGNIYWDIFSVNLYPVSIIALHPKADDTQSLEFNYQDKMAHDGGAVLNRNPVINSIRKSGNYGFDPVLRGFKYDQLNVVISGVQSATAACPNRMDPPTSQVAPNMIDRVEILKGPHALRYGNSFGGTINFIPSDPRFSDQSQTYGRLSGEYNSNGDLIRSEGIIGFSGEKYDLGIFGSWSQGNDYLDGEGNAVPSGFMRGSFGTMLGLKIINNQQISISATRNLARDAIFAALPMDLRKDDTWLLNAAHTISFAGKTLQLWNTAIYGTLIDHLMDNTLKKLDPRTLNTETDAKTFSFGGRTEATWKPGDGLLYTGIDAKLEGAEGSRVREFFMGPNAGRIFTDNAWQKGRIVKSSLFAEYHLRRKGGLKFVFSGRLELNISQALDAQEEFTDIYPETSTTQINPNLSIGSIKQLKAISVGVWLGRAQRSGSLTERFINYFPVGQDPYEMLGNPQLKPEKNNQVDLTFEYRTVKTYLDVDVFACYLNDNISSLIDTSLTPRLPNSPGVRQYINIDKAFKTGFEINWKQNLIAGLEHNLSLAYTYGLDMEKDEPLPEIAPFDIRYNLYGLFLKNRLRPEVSFRFVSEQNRVSGEFGETITPSFFTLDALVTYTFLKIFSVSTGVQNVFDEAYYEHLNRSVTGTAPRPIYAPGRNFFLSLSLNFM